MHSTDQLQSEKRHPRFPDPPDVACCPFLRKGKRTFPLPCSIKELGVGLVGLGLDQYG